MSEMTAWDVAILMVAAYIAVVTLVRLMRRRRDVAIAQLQTEVAAQLERNRSDRQREQSRSGRGKPTSKAPRGARR